MAEKYDGLSIQIGYPEKSREFMRGEKMGRLIDVDNIEYYLEEGGSVVAFKADIDQIPSAQPDKEALDDAYAHGYTYAESKYRAMMSDGDCISRQTAIDAIEHRLAEPAYQHTGEDWYVGMNSAESELYALPSVRPEIIRCKDCKHSHEDKLFTMLWCHGDIVDKNHFCSRAERRTDENND